jgi:hypothetical protein
MTKRRRKSEQKLGRTDRYPSDYGVRDREQGENAEENNKRVPGEEGKGREGHSKGCGGSGQRGTGTSGPERK